MKRDIVDKLTQWQVDLRRKPLILMGPRQVGKTYALQQFAADHYANNLYLNFEDMPSLGQLFEASLSPKDLLQALSIEMGKEILPEKTLIIFDEVQMCPQALNALKYFNETANEYHVCAAGSLLGVRLEHSQGFPVGKVNFLHCYPVSFMEFLQATGQEQLKDYLEAIDKIVPIPPNLHERAMALFKTYLYLGGMPEVIAHYAQHQDLAIAREIQQEILTAYSLDFAKHAPANQIMKINQVWDNIPSQLAKENKKFIYSVLRRGARASEFEVAIQWLQDAGLIYKVYNTMTAKLPIKAYARHDFFKIYLSDVGLLGAQAELSAKTLLHGDALFQEFHGALIENYIAQALKRQGQSLYYWTSEGKAELDFIITVQDKIYPLEIKAGSSSHKKSLKIYGEKYQPEISIRCSPMNLRLDGNILNCPLYLFEGLRQLL